MASIDDLSLFALAPSEELGRTVAENHGIALAPHELHHERSITEVMEEQSWT